MATKKIRISNDFDKIFQYAKRQPELESVFLHDELKEGLKSLQQYHNKDVEKYITSFLVVRSITFFEVSMMNITKYIVNSLDPDLTLLFREEWNIPTSKISDMLNQKLTKGDIVTASFNFQDREEIFPLLSKLLRLNFEESIKEISNINHQDELITASKNLVKNWYNFEQIFEMRHNFVHTWYQIGKRKYDYVESLVNSVIDFVRLSIFLIFGVELHHKSKLDIPEIRNFIHGQLENYKNQRIR